LLLIFHKICSKVSVSPQRSSGATLSSSTAVDSDVSIIDVHTLQWAVNEPPTRGKHFIVKRVALLHEFEKKYVKKEQKVVVYGHEQCGKSTFAGQLAEHLRCSGQNVVLCIKFVIFFLLHFSFAACLTAKRTTMVQQERYSKQWESNTRNHCKPSCGSKNKSEMSFFFS
jgi:hypothetical protein